MVAAVTDADRHEHRHASESPPGWTSDKADAMKSLCARSLTLLTPPPKEPPRALRHWRLVGAAVTAHNDEHPNHNRSQERADPS